MSAPDEARDGHAGFQHALVQMDRARPGDATDGLRIAELWQGMKDGRWSVVEHFDCDGHRYFLLCSATGSRAASRLSKREQQVLDLANSGFSNKLIGCSLDMSISTVSTYLARARKKLRQQFSARTMADALALEISPPRVEST